jgi:hypothetical protein
MLSILGTDRASAPKASANLASTSIPSLVSIPPPELPDPSGLSNESGARTPRIVAVMTRIVAV